MWDHHVLYSKSHYPIHRAWRSSGITTLEVSSLQLLGVVPLDERIAITPTYRHSLCRPLASILGSPCQACGSRRTTREFRNVLGKNSFSCQNFVKSHPALEVPYQGQMLLIRNAYSGLLRRLYDSQGLMVGQHRHI